MDESVIKSIRNIDGARVCIQILFSQLVQAKQA